MRPKYELGVAPYSHPEKGALSKVRAFIYRILGGGPIPEDQWDRWHLEEEGAEVLVNKKNNANNRAPETDEDLVDGVTVYILGETRGWDGTWRKGVINGKHQGDYVVDWSDSARHCEFYSAGKILSDQKRFREMQSGTLPPNRWI